MTRLVSRVARQLSMVMVVPLFLSGCDFSDFSCSKKLIDDGCYRPHSYLEQSLSWVDVQSSQVVARSGATVDVVVASGMIGTEFAEVKESPSGNVFILGGSANKIVRKFPGSDRWEVRSLNGFYGYVRDIEFIDAKNMVAVGDNGAIYHSQDAGDSWEIYNPAFFSEGGGLEDLKFETAYSVSFSDADTGVVGGTDRLFITDDGGKTWRRRLKTISDFVVQKVRFGGDGVGWATTNKGLLRTAGGAEYWSYAEFGVGHAVGLDVVDHDFVAYTVGSSVLSSEGGGAFEFGSIEWGDDPAGESLITNIAMQDRQRGWFVTEKGSVFHTVDGHGWKPWLNVLDALRSTFDTGAYYEVELWGVDVSSTKVYVAGSLRKVETTSTSRIHTTLPVLLSWNVAAGAGSQAKDAIAEQDK